MKKRKLIAALVLALGIPAAAQAALFDADGTGGVASAQNIGAFDWGPTGIFADQANVAIANFATGGCANGGCQFDLYTHAALIGVLDSSGAALPTPTGLNSTYEITMIAKFTEVVTGVVGNIVTFATVPTIAGFLQIFYDNTPDAVAVSGSGYNDGRLILSGTQIGSASSLFQITSTTSQALDQSPNGDQYTGQLTLPGTGSSTNIPVNALAQDNTFFLSTLAAFGVQFANISLGLPYVSVDPSDCYTGAAQAVAIGATAATSGCTTLHVNGLMSAQDVPGAPGIRPDIGPVNGFSGSGPDFVAQSDYNSPLQTVPEPGSLALLGLGMGILGLLGGVRRRFGMA